ncbi:hypothetical protein [Leptolyngbya sp. GGD]|uniref:hypothetical protein n=1 Tax=Leptolyngbya sp. GGD TaxID=2997907 RepID=UPI00227ACEC8|nr:hypothetical protein [Leptolyngbya sp. GGD]MCY6493939.1 hypothetical protein [Leptolyngbya sp. GGD]
MTLTESLGNLNLLSQLAARAYTFALSPSVLETAKAWAIIMGVATTALYVVIQETNKKGETSLRIGPDEEPDPDWKKKPKAPPVDDKKEQNRMRLQLQDDPGNTFGIPIENSSLLGVTVSQVGQAVFAMWQYRRTLASWFPKDHDTALIKAMAGVTKKAKNAQAEGGVFQGSSQVYSRQWNENDPKGIKPVSRGYYRVDFENLQGHNLRF